MQVISIPIEVQLEYDRQQDTRIISQDCGINLTSLSFSSETNLYSLFLGFFPKTIFHAGRGK